MASRKTTLGIFGFLILIVLVLLSTHIATADTSNITPPKVTNDTSNINPPIVTKICDAKGKEIVVGDNVTIGLGKTITIVVDGLSDYLEKTQKVNQKLVPYIDGRPIKDVDIYPTQTYSSQDRLQFYIKRTSTNKDVWIDLFRNPTFSYRKVTFSIGLENEPPFPTKFDINNKLNLTVIPIKLFFCFLIGFVILFVLFMWHTIKSNTLRDSGPKPVNGEKKPYSLGRTQMAFWFFIIVMSFAYISMITWDCTIPSSALGLMGISASTALLAVFVDSNKRTDATNQLQSLLTKKQALGADDKTRLPQLLDEEISALESAKKPLSSEGFFTDILTDANGISFHRFQIVIWTIGLGITFIISVIHNLEMQEFNETLLALMGISSGTYVGFKFPEKQN